MDRFFLDANVLFSAAYREHAGLLRIWNLSGVKLLSSAYAVEEARRNLATGSQRGRLAELVRSLEIIDTATRAPGEIALPDKDQLILGAAIAGHATHLVTGDVRHFGESFGKKLAGVLVLLPGEYLRSHERRRHSG